MIFSIYGKTKDVLVDSVVIAVSGIGYQVFVVHPELFIKDNDVFLLIYEVIKEDEHYLVGFTSKEEKDVFNLLIKVKGLGPKSVITALKGTTPDKLINAIASNNLTYLKRLPGIGSKMAGQIILDLNGQLTGKKGDPYLYEEVRDALKELGFKGTKIDKVLETINEPNLTSTELLKIALAKLRN